MTTHLLFPTLVFEDDLTHLEKYNQHLVDKAYNLKNKFPNVDNEWRCDTYNTLNHYEPGHDNDPVVNELIKECGNRVLGFSSEWGIKPTKIRCVDFWLNIAHPGDYQEYHNHPNSHFSLAYYIQSNPDSGNITFKSLDSIADMHPLPLHKAETAASFGTYSFVPKNNKLLIFRSTLLHMVEKNKSNEDRISVTMNFNIDNEL
jgi:uncharacterized protein (TIGR02466 family)